MTLPVMVEFDCSSSTLVPPVKVMAFAWAPPPPEPPRMVPSFTTVMLTRRW